jgi:hypothetical protein
MLAESDVPRTPYHGERFPARNATRIRDALEEWGVVVSWGGRVVDPFVYDVHAALAAEERRRIRRRSMDGMDRAAVKADTWEA